MANIIKGSYNRLAQQPGSGITKVSYSWDAVINDLYAFVIADVGEEGYRIKCDFIGKIKKVEDDLHVTFQPLYFRILVGNSKANRKPYQIPGYQSYTKNAFKEQLKETNPRGVLKSFLQFGFTKPVKFSDGRFYQIEDSSKILAYLKKNNKTYKKCPSDQERSNKTLRCMKKCKPGQTRSLYSGKCVK